MPVMIWITVSNENMSDTLPFSLWYKRGKPKPVKKQSTGVDGDFSIARVDQEGILTIEPDSHYTSSL